MSDKSGDDKVYEMQWDCPYCDTKKLLGLTHRFCPNCGAAQDDSARYFPSDDEKVAVEDHVYVGADKVCDACDTPNAATAEYCGQCGNPMTAAAQAKRQADQTRGEEDAAFKSMEARAEEQREQLAANEASSKKTKFIILGIITVLLLAGVTFLFWTKQVAVTLESFSWERNINIERYSAVRESSWCDNVPTGAYDMSRSREVRDHKQVPDGQTCQTRRIDQGDGTFRETQECQTKYRDVPIYADKCHYVLDKWIQQRDLKAEAQDRNPKWPAVKLACTAQRLGCEREGKRAETYYLHLLNAKEKKDYRCDVDQKLWRDVQLKSQWHLEVSQMTGGARCGTLAPLN